MVKPELIIQDMGGFHNNDLEGTSARLVRGGSWKKQRIITIMPSADVIAARVVLSWLNLAYPPNNGVVRILALGQEVGEAYSNAIESVLAHPELKNWEYICVIEHDNIVPPDGIIKLVEHMENHPEFAAISSLYHTKGYGGVPQIWGDPQDPSGLNFRPQPPDPKGGLVECNGIGMGFALYRLEMFKDKKLRRPWFKTQKENGIATQDLYFWSDARKHGYRAAVSCDIRTGHHDLSGSFGIADFVW